MPIPASISKQPSEIEAALSSIEEGSKPSISKQPSEIEADLSSIEEEGSEAIEKQPSKSEADLSSIEEGPESELSISKQPSETEADLSSIEEGSEAIGKQPSEIEADLSSIEEEGPESEAVETEAALSSIEEGKGSQKGKSSESSSSSNGLMYFGGSKLDGMVLKDGNNNIFLGKLKKKEPTVFLSEDDGKYSAYSKICQASSHRQPIILTPEEKEKIDAEDTKNGSKSYSHALEYGSDPSNKNFYICPRFWCLKTNAPISEKDALEGKCGKILPAGAKKVEPGHYVIEFNNAKQHTDKKDGKYLENSPGFIEGNRHPKGLCMPCCFKTAWDSKSQVERRKECAIEQKQPENGEPRKPAAAKKAKKLTTKQETYIIDIRRYPIPQNRWGFLPISVQYFLQIDNSLAVHPDNNKYLREDRPVSTILRYGVENSAKKSFIGCIADIYAYIGEEFRPLRRGN